MGTVGLNMSQQLFWGEASTTHPGEAGFTPREHRHDKGPEIKDRWYWANEGLNHAYMGSISSDLDSILRNTILMMATNANERLMPLEHLAVLETVR